MTNKKIPILAIPIVAALLIGVLMTPAHAGLPITTCSQDKTSPTTGDQGGNEVREEAAGAKCYIDGASNLTVDIHDASKVFILNSDISGATHITGTTDKLKVEGNTFQDNVVIDGNNVTHLEFKDNYATAATVLIQSNTADILKIKDNMVVGVNLSQTTVNDFASCKNNSDLTGSNNDYNTAKMNQGCPGAIPP